MAGPLTNVLLTRVFIIACAFILSFDVFKYDGVLSFSSNEIYKSPQLVQIYGIDDEDSSLDLSKTVYHFQKRSAESVSPIKKATQNEKKVTVKTDSISSSSVLKKPIVEDKNEVSVSVATQFNVTTIQTMLAKEVYNTEVASSSTPSTLPSTASSRTSTALPEMFPTKPSNITNTTVDHHVYYNSTFFLEPEKAMSYWVNFDHLPKSKIITHHMLSDSHRRAATVTLSFDFPFYGHPLRNITIATGGFLYMGDYMHSWLAATQYVAPLMANFDTSLSNESTVRYFDNGTAFVIEWNEVALQEEEQGGNFTFQATLLQNGNIIFVYHTIPVSVTEIGDELHPVKVGLSDAYVIDRVIYFIRRKTIYEYHRIDMKKEEIGNQTAIYFTALTTCLNFQNCNACMTAEIGLECVWCDSVKRCSDGLDRQRQDWLQQRCDVEKSHINCNELPSTDSYPIVQPFTEMPPKTYTIHTPPEAHDHPARPQAPPFQPSYHKDDGEVTSRKVKGEEPVGVGGVIVILLILGLVLGAGSWIGYAYRNPNTSSGQLLIRYRPTQWRFRSGEARYTAASVHM